MQQPRVSPWLVGQQSPARPARLGEAVSSNQKALEAIRSNQQPPARHARWAGPSTRDQPDDGYGWRSDRNRVAISLTAGTGGDRIAIGWHSPEHAGCAEHAIRSNQKQSEAITHLSTRDVPSMLASTLAAPEAARASSAREAAAASAARSGGRSVRRDAPLPRRSP